MAQIQIYGTLPGGGGNTQTKDVTITENGQTTITPDTGFDSMTEVNVTTNVASGGDYDGLGYEIDVEAGTTIDKGDRIIAVENDQSIGETFNATNSDVRLTSCSADGTVGMAVASLQQSIYTDSVINIYFKNEQTGQFDSYYALTISQYPNDRIKLYNNFIFNEDGTLAVSAYHAAQSSVATESYMMFIRIDKQNKTATYEVKRIFFENLLPESSQDTYKVTIDMCEVYKQTSSDTVGSVVSNYILCPAKAHIINKSSGSSNAVNSTFVILKYNSDNSLTLEHYNKPPVSNGSSATGTVTKQGTMVNNVIRFLYKSGASSAYLATFDTTNNNLLVGISSAPNYQYVQFSQNYEHCSYTSATNTVNVYDVDWISLSTTLNKTLTTQTPGTGNVCYPSDDGKYLLDACSGLEKSGIYNIITGEKLYTFGANSASYLADYFFKPSGSIRVASSSVGTFILSLVPSTDAEYIVSKANEYSGSGVDTITGVASSGLVVGQRGEARALNKLQYKEVTITQNGTTTITPDTGYDGLNGVSANFSSEFNVIIDDTQTYVPSTLGGLRSIIAKVNMDGISLNNFNDLFYKCTSLQEVIGTIDTSSLTNYGVGEMFKECSSLVSLPIFDTSSITYFNSFCYGCTNLANVPIFSMSSLQFYAYTTDMFKDCPNLTNDSLNNIMSALGTALFNPRNCTLKNIGLSETQATTCTTLSNWASLEAAGWTTGY